MKYFQHRTALKDDENMKALISQFGYAGYGWFFRIQEVLAHKMDETDRCHYEQPSTEWCSLLKVKRKQLVCFLKALEKLFGFKVVCSDLLIRISDPKLLERHDNYTKRCRQKAAQGQNNDGKMSPLEVEVEVKKNKTPGREKPAPRKLFFSSEDLEIATSFWVSISRLYPTTKEPDLKKWANDVRLMRVVDKRTTEQIKEVFKYANNDNRFWASTVLSASGLRNNFDKIVAQMGDTKKRAANSNCGTSRRLVF